MKIELLGIPDGRTAALERVVLEALTRLGRTGEAELSRVEDMTAMIARGVRQPPALRVDGVVGCRRRVPTVDEVVAWLGGGEGAGTE